MIEAPANSERNVYIKSATLNGLPFTTNYISHKDLVKGGLLKLEMSNEPNKNRGLKPEDQPFSLSK